MTDILPTRNCPRGAEWRRWDLHVHTPHSHLNNGFGNDFQVYAKQLIESVCRNNIVAVGLTDYFSLSGYRELRKLLSDSSQLEQLVGCEKADQVRRVLFLPNIELRSDILMGANRVNYHVLFSNELDPEEIEENFLRELRFVSESAPGAFDSELSLTEKNLASLGKQLKQQHSKFNDRSDLCVGMMNATISHTDVTKILERTARFRDRYLIVVPADEDLSKISWDGQGHQTRKVLLQKAHAIFSSNQKTRNFFLGRYHSTVEAYLEEFKARRPCFHGSDAHCYDKLFEPDEKRYCWIKADASFAGLRQTLVEPEHRVFIGERPPIHDDLNLRKTKTIDRVVIAPVDGVHDASFNSTIELNHQLVAIIGNKGSGKSALADIIALSANSKKVPHFSFLRKDRFRASGGRAKSHQGSLVWADGAETKPIRLDQDPPTNAPECLRYIPQQYLEQVCNDVSFSENSLFYQELQDVIFSHIPNEERLGSCNLEELLHSQQSALDVALETKAVELRQVVRELVDIRSRATSQHKETLEQRLDAKQRELQALEQSRPEEVADPQVALAQDLQLNGTSLELKETTAQIEDLETQMTIMRDRLREVSLGLDKVQLLRRLIETLKSQIVSFQAQALPLAQELGLDSPIFTHELQEKIVADHDDRLSADKAAVQAQLDLNNPSSLASKLKNAKERATSLSKKLGEPQELYQKYTQALSIWEQQRSAIIGDINTAETLAYIEHQLSELAKLPELEKSTMSKRDELARELYALRSALRDVYAGHCQHVQNYLEQHPIICKGQINLAFRAGIRDVDLLDSLHAMLDRRGGDLSAISSLVETADWTTVDGFIQFARKMDEFFTKNSGTILFKKNSSVDSFLNYIFSGVYLRPVYHLSFEGKQLSQLSPGERGSLMLIFYLLLDRHSTPLIIDQPEENLDNQTVVRILVPCIIEAKQRRQLILVTHNPNLAVVCDAEQIIVAQVEKGEYPRFSYQMGPIEDAEINAHILNILEGTRPAFDIRDSKYLQGKPSLQ